MMACMTRRGPDSHGLLQRGRVILGHQRLSIIDLSLSASQPMEDAALGLSIVYNGAIYNYPELRAELSGMGYTFFSHGDTEVILKAYHAWGEKALEKFNGMFAFAIYERETGRTFIARDRLGIKPVYLAETHEGLVFASSLPAILRYGGMDTSIDPVALNYYLTFHSIVPAPRTMLKCVQKLPPATWMRVEADGTSVEQHQYWRVEFGTPPEWASWTEDQWMDKTLEVMRAAVKRRLVADVPVGVLLSGGLDSSLIVGLLAEQGQTVETFSIGFETVGEERGDEFQYSDIVAEHFKTKHHQLFIDSNKALPALRECISQMSEPMVSHDNVGFYLLSQEVAKFVKVVQSGQGADEIFGGYHWYPPMLDSADPVADYARAFFDRPHAEYLEVIADRYRCERDNPLHFVEDHFALSGADRPIDKALRIDQLIMLVDDPVKRVDNNTMAASLEARVPFLDHEVVEYAAKVPGELKVKDDGKYILKEAARKVIPSAVIDRPKGYFPVPALKYLRGPFLDMAKNALLNDTARQRGVFNGTYVENLLANPEAHITPLRGSKLWQLALLELWLQEHKVG